MNSSTFICLELFGVHKRIPDIERISHSIDKQVNICRINAFTANNCQAIFYHWGHILIYTWPEISLLNIEILSNMNNIETQVLKETILNIYKPKQYTSFDTTQITGFK